MKKLSIGQMFELFEGMAHYVKLTNPWGGGDGEAPRKGNREGMDFDEFATEVSRLGILRPQVKTVDQLDAHTLMASKLFEEGG